MGQHPEFAVVDVETTGLSAAKHDRIIEIAIIRVDGSGGIIDEYSTLVNPKRDVGSTQIHGLSAGQLKNAPEFIDIAGDVLHRVAGAVLAAHNAIFDLSFLKSEFGRVGVALPDAACLCTMKLAGAIGCSLPSRRLADLCRFFGIENHREHSALDDARATANVLFACLRKCRRRLPLSISDLDDLGVRGQILERSAWPTLPVSGRTYARETQALASSRPSSFIAQLIPRLPLDTSRRPEINQYFALLDQVLEDRRVTSSEAESLATLAIQLGLSRTLAVEAHELYLRELVRIANADGFVSESEKSDINDVRKLLDISEDRYLSIMAEEVLPGCDIAKSHSAPANLISRQLQNKSVCFTGELRCSVNGRPATRDYAEAVASSAGMIIKQGVVKSLDYLVVADPDSMSGKAEKARRYGVRIIAEPAFWHMLGVGTD
jgi:DNA polymerase-3 subunit epsilon